MLLAGEQAGEPALRVLRAGCEVLLRFPSPPRAQDPRQPPFAGRAARNFRANFNELWDKCLREAHAAGLLFDQYLLDKTINLLIALNTSTIRNFRQVATLTASQLVTSIIHVMLTLTEARETAARQLAAEEKKKGGKVRGAAPPRCSAPSRRPRCLAPCPYPARASFAESSSPRCLVRVCGRRLAASAWRR